jgi:Skp family chaperone for outer membrane proteins
VKRIIVVVLFLATLTAVYFVGSSRAQQTSPVMATRFTKVGVVNYITLANGYEKVKQLKDRTAKALEPFRAKKEELEKIILEWSELLKNPDGKLREQNLAKGQQIIIDCRRQLEDLEMKYKTDVVERNEKELEVIWNELEDAICEHGRTQGFHLILGYGEPEKELPPMASIQRKMSAVEKGGIRNAYSAGAVDVTTALLRTLNRPEPVMPQLGQPVEIDPPR